MNNFDTFEFTLKLNKIYITLNFDIVRIFLVKHI